MRQAVAAAINLDIALSALEQQGQGRILSTPRVSTQNNVEAEITQGVQCFDTSKGLASCPNNSLPVIAKVLEPDMEKIAVSPYLIEETEDEVVAV